MWTADSRSDIATIADGVMTMTDRTQYVTVTLPIDDARLLRKMVGSAAWRPWLRNNMDKFARLTLIEYKLERAILRPLVQAYTNESESSSTVIDQPIPLWPTNRKEV